MRSLTIAVLAVFWPSQAWAHTSIPGMTGFYWGLLHPFTVPAQLLALLAIALVVQQQLPRGEDLLKGFVIACIVGGGAAAASVVSTSVDLPLTIVAIVVGLLAASAITLQKPVLWILGLLSGFLSGIVSWPDPGSTNAMLFSASGAIFGSIMVIVIIASTLETMQQKIKWGWLPIATRVIASWISAVSFLLGALSLRGLL